MTQNEKPDASSPASLLADTLRIEAKFTTGNAIQLPHRELDALLSGDEKTRGLIAALFLEGPRRRVGVWLVVDAADPLINRRGSGARLSRRDMAQLMLSHDWLTLLHRHIEQEWPKFLWAYRELAFEGHSVLLPALEAAHRSGELHRPLDVDEILQIDHLSVIQRILENHEESGAGRVFQDLFAFFLLRLGYSRVTVNTVGVPDIVLSRQPLKEVGSQIRIL